MTQGTGIPVYPGIAIGPAVVYPQATAPAPQAPGSPQEEKEKFTQALTTAKAQLSQLFEEATQALGPEQAAIVEVQLLMLEDLDFLEEVEAAIDQGATACQAVLDTGEAFGAMFASLDDAYMQARSADIRDVAQRLSHILTGTTGFTPPQGEFLLAAEDLGPSQTIQLPREQILAFVTQGGSTSSHTAILARTLNIPSLIQADIPLDSLEKANILAIDGFAGTWYIDPDEATLACLREKLTQWKAAQAGLEAYRGRPTVTKSGKRLLLCANIGSPEDAQLAADGDAEGIGLMRSEFLYLGRTTLPTEEELFQAYRQVAQTMGSRPVIIRTLDVGADKQADYLGLEKEENPALGLRGLRICLTREDIFLPQLRAIYRASAYGNLSLMFPMIASPWELRQAKALCAQVRQELHQQGVPFREIPIGVMIETPAAAILARELAQEADFFSVGTNDLTQYTLAVDRQNAKLGPFYDPHHPALLRLLAHIASCANQAGIWAGICGELGADPAMTEEFVKMGYQELSMAPGKILEIRKIICESEE